MDGEKFIDGSLSIPVLGFPDVKKKWKVKLLYVSILLNSFYLCKFFLAYYWISCIVNKKKYSK